MTRRRLVAGAAAVGYSKLVVTVSQLLLVPVLAHSWGLVLYGQWLLLSTIPAFLAAGDFGFALVAGNRLIGEVARGETGAAERTFQSGLAVILLLSGGLLALAMIAVLAIPPSLLRAEGGMGASEARLAMDLLCVGGVVSIQRSLFMGVSRSVGHFARSTALDTTFALGETGVIIGVAVAGGGVIATAAAVLAVRICSTLGLAALARHQAHWLRIGFCQADRSLVREMLRPSIAAMLLPLSHALFLQGTAIAVGAAGGPALVPAYTALRTLARTGLQLLQAISQPVMPEYTAADARGERDHAKQLAGMLATLSIAGGVGYAACLAVAGQPVLHFWTQGAIAAPEVAIFVFAASVVFGALWPQVANLLIAINRHEGFSVCYAVVSALAVVLTHVLVRHFGVTGGAISYLSVDIAMTAILFAIMRRQGRLPGIGIAPVFAVLGKRKPHSR